MPCRPVLSVQLPPPPALRARLPQSAREARLCLTSGLRGEPNLRRAASTPRRPSASKRYVSIVKEPLCALAQVQIVYTCLVKCQGPSRHPSRKRCRSLLSSIRPVPRPTAGFNGRQPAADDHRPATRCAACVSRGRQRGSCLQPHRCPAWEMAKRSRAKRWLYWVSWG
jgi:hypothetical protein